MAIEIASAYVSIIPSARGIEQKLAREFADAGRQAAKSFERSFESGVDVGAPAGDAGGDAGKSFSSKFEAFSLGAVGGIAAGFGMGLLGALSGILSAGAQSVVDGFMGAIERSATADRLAAQVGATGDEADKLGRITGAIYASAWGESIGEVSEALRAAVQSGIVSPELPEADIQAITSQLIMVADLMGEDVTLAARAVSRMLRTGVADNAEEAFDVLIKGTQEGGNVSEDLLDTFEEYSIIFDSLGVDAETAMGMLVQAMRAGARNTDVAADALLEFSVRGKDLGDPDAMQAFRDLGFDAEEMAAKIARGGPDAAEALATVTEKMRLMEDPVLRNQVAVGLFGTKAEDMQAALGAIDPTTAVDALGSVEGAAATASDTMTDNFSTSVEELRRIFSPENLLNALNTGGWEALTAEVGRGVEQLQTLWDTYGPYIRQAFDQAWQGIQQWWNETAKPWIDNVLVPEIQAKGDELVNSLTTWLAEALLNAVEGAVGMLPYLIGAIAVIAATLARAFFSGFARAIRESPMVRVLAALGGTVPFLGPFAQFATILSNLPEFATGGIVDGRLGSPQLALVHSGETILPTHRMPYAAAAAAVGVGGSGFNVTQTIVAPTPRMAGAEVARELRKQATLMGAA